jgi:hypothetical protein
VTAVLVLLRLHGRPVYEEIVIVVRVAMVTGKL